ALVRFAPSHGRCRPAPASRWSATRPLLPAWNSLSSDVGRAVGESLFPLIERTSPPFQLRWRLGAVLNGQFTLTLSLRRFDPPTAAYRRPIPGDQRSSVRAESIPRCSKFP